MTGKVLLAVSTIEGPEEMKARLRSAGFEVKENPWGRRLTAEEVVALGNDCVGLIAGLEPLSRDVLSQLPMLRCISRVGVGADNVDKVYARDRGIDVRITPDAPVRSVVEYTLGVLLSLVRHVPSADRDVRGGTWKRRLGIQVAGRTVGVIGLGRIGKGVAKALVALGANVVATDSAPDTSWCAAHAVRLVSLAELLSLSDVVTLHALTPAGAPPLLGAAELRAMRKGAYLVNTARGGLIDETALQECLVSGHLSGAALDVFEQEPYKGTLRTLENVILTPHVAAHTKESREQMETEAVANLIESLRQTHAHARE